MADLTGTPTSGAGLAGDVYLAANYEKFKNSQSDVGRELIVKFAKTNITHSDLLAYTRAITQAGGVAGALPASTGDAFTVAAVGTADGSAFVSGTTDVVYMRVQGTGTFDTTDAAASVGGTTVTVEAVFAPAL